MAVLDYSYMMTDASADVLTPAVGTMIRVFTLSSHIDQKSVGWNISDGVDSVKLTNSSTDTRLGAGVIMAEHDGWVGGKALGGFGMPVYILDENLSLNQSKDMDTGNAAIVCYQVIKEA
jgi:hypothetical protein